VPDSWFSLPASSAHLVFSAAPCACGARPASLARRQRAARLVHLDRARSAGLVTEAEAAERRAELLAR
jgi:hypothetical protein